MEELRRFVRVAGPAGVTYTVLPSGTSRQAALKNLSAGGLCLTMDKPLAAGTQLQIAVSLPGRGEPVNAIGETLWSQETQMISSSGRRTSVDVGVRFAEIAPQDQEALAEFVFLTLHTV